MRAADYRKQAGAAMNSRWDLEFALEREIDEDERREAIEQRRNRRRRSVHRTYDDWKLANPDDDGGQDGPRSF